MTKLPDELGVKFTVSDITVEVPKALFETSAIKVAVFFGRKGRSALTRRTKWFTIADPSLVEMATRTASGYPANGDDPLEGSAHRSSTSRGAGDSAENSTRQAPPGEMAVLRFGGTNQVVYETELRPLNKFDGEWVFDQKLTHPVTAFAKIFIKTRPGVKANAAKSEQESNLNDMLQMDQSEMEDDFSDDDDATTNQHDPNAVSALEMSTDVALTQEQLTMLSGGKSENEMLLEDLKHGRDCKKRYLAFPKLIDLAEVANTKVKTLRYSERLKCKSISLMGTVVSFSIAAEVDESKLNKYETKKKEKEDKEERKRREKEEKILEKERKKVEKAEAKERKKQVGSTEQAYGADVTDGDAGDGHPTAAATTPSKEQQNVEKGKSGFSPFNAIRSIFMPKEKQQTTPFAIKYENTPYPYLFLLDKFILQKLVMPPQFYRGVHIRLGCDSADINGFPLLLLNTSNTSFLHEESVRGYDGEPKNIFKFDFADTHVYFADKHIRNITGFDTIRALTEREKNFTQAKERATAGAGGDPAAQGANAHLFHAEILNVGETFKPMAFEASKYSASGAQVESTKFTRVVAQLVVPKKVENVKMMTDEEEKRAYIKKLEKEQRAREEEMKKEEKRLRKAEKAAAKAEAAGQGTSEEDDEVDDSSDDVPDDVTEHGSPRPHHDGAPAAEAAKDGEAEAPAAGSEKAEDENADQSEKVNGTASAENGDAEQPGSDAAAAEGEEGEALETAYESGGVAEQKAPKSPKASSDSRFSTNKTSSFQLGFQLINEEILPAEGVNYSIRFETGEELVFRARRIFLPSVCPTGQAGASITDVPLLDFSPNATA